MDIPHVRQPVVDRQARLPRHVEKRRAVVYADHLAAELCQPLGDAAVTAGNVEHAHAGLEPQEPDDQLDIHVGALVGEHVPGEVEVVVAEYLVEVVADHGPV